MYEKFYVHEIAAVDLSKIYFLKNAMKICKRNTRDLNHNWKLWKYWNFFLKIRILSFIRSSPNSTFNSHNSKGIKFLSRLRLGLSHLGEHKFKHSFQHSLNLFCSCLKGKFETISHYLLHFSSCSEERLALLNTAKIIDMPILQQSDSEFIAFYFLATILSTIAKTFLSSMPL